MGKLRNFARGAVFVVGVVGVIASEANEDFATSSAQTNVTLTAGGRREVPFRVAIKRDDDRIIAGSVDITVSSRVDDPAAFDSHLFVTSAVDTVEVDAERGAFASLVSPQLELCDDDVCELSGIVTLSRPDDGAPPQPLSLHITGTANLSEAVPNPPYDAVTVTIVGP